MVTVAPCLAAVGLRARGPTILSCIRGCGADTDLALVTEFVDAELLNRRRRRPEDPGGEDDRGTG